MIDSHSFDALYTALLGCLQEFLIEIMPAGRNKPSDIKFFTQQKVHSICDRNIEAWWLQDAR